VEQEGMKGEVLCRKDAIMTSGSVSSTSDGALCCRLTGRCRPQGWWQPAVDQFWQTTYEYYRTWLCHPCTTSVSGDVLYPCIYCVYLHLFCVTISIADCSEALGSGEA